MSSEAAEQRQQAAYPIGGPRVTLIKPTCRPKIVHRSGARRSLRPARPLEQAIGELQTARLCERTG